MGSGGGGSSLGAVTTPIFPHSDGPVCRVAASVAAQFQLPQFLSPDFREAHTSKSHRGAAALVHDRPKMSRVSTLSHLHAFV